MTQSTRPTVRVTLPHLRAWRIARFLSQAELIATAQVAKTTIVALERGYHSANTRTVRSLAAALGLTPHELIHTAPPDAKTA